MNPPGFIEWSREEKEEYAEQLMHEMRVKNAELRRRHAEVEHDRIAAENKNSAVTIASKALKKEKNEVHHVPRTERRMENFREWDQGKSDKDGKWKPPDYHGSFKSYRTGHYERKDSNRKDSRVSHSKNDDDSWNDHTPAATHPRKRNGREDSYSKHTRNENVDRYKRNSVSHNLDNRKPRGNYKYSYDNDQYNVSRFHSSPKKHSKEVGYQNAECHKSRHAAEKSKKIDLNHTNARRDCNRNHSRSNSDYECMDNNVTTIQLSDITASTLWCNDKYDEDRNRQARLNSWLETTSKPNKAEQTTNSKPYSKFDRFEHSSNESSDNEDSLSGENKSKENCNLEIQKLEYHENKSQKEVTNSAREASNDQSNSVKKTYNNKSNFINESSYKSRSGASNVTSYKNMGSGKGKFSNNIRSSFGKAPFSNISSNFTKQNIEVSKNDYKMKRNPEYTSAEGFKVDQLSKQRKFDKEDKNGIWSNTSQNEDRNIEKKHKNTNCDNTDQWTTKKHTHEDDSIWVIKHSCDQVDDGIWGDIDSHVDDSSVWDTKHTHNDVDDGIWNIQQPKQSNMKWNLSGDETENVNVRESSIEKKPTTSDDGGWSTVTEEGEIKSEDEEVVQKMANWAVQF